MFTEGVVVLLSASPEISFGRPCLQYGEQKRASMTAAEETLANLLHLPA